MFCNPVTNDDFFMSVFFEIENVNQLKEPAKYIAELTQRYHVFSFYGAMGAGKTTFIKEICIELQIDDLVNSPTFAIINQYVYRPGKSVYHFDFYRINKLEEVYDMGYEDYFYSNNICFIEWPEKIEELLPEENVSVQIEDMGGSKRKIIINVPKI